MEIMSSSLPAVFFFSSALLGDSKSLVQGGREDSAPKPPLSFDLPSGKRPCAELLFLCRSASNCPGNAVFAICLSRQPRGAQPAPGWESGRGRGSTEMLERKERASLALPFHPCCAGNHLTLAVTCIPCARDAVPVPSCIHVHSPDPTREPNELVCVGNASQDGGWGQRLCTEMVSPTRFPGTSKATDAPAGLRWLWGQ